MPKYYTYEVGDCVLVNEKAVNGVEGIIGLKGVIVEKLITSQYDYEVLLEDGTPCRLNEYELTYIT